MTETQSTAALAIKPVELSGAVTDLDSAMRLAKTLAMAAVMPDAIRNKPADVLAMVLYGQDLGLSPMQAIQGIYVVKGKPQLSAQLWIALARRAGHRVLVRDHTITSCTVEITRGDTGEQHAETFTIGDAQRAELAGKDIWQKYPKRMLLARAISDCCRFICPEIALGFYAEGDDFADPITVVEPPAEAEAPTTDVIDGEVVDDVSTDADLADLAQRYDFTQPSAKGRWYPEMPPYLSDDETDAQYTDRLTGADGTDRVPYDHRRRRQCAIGFHDECSDPAGEECECPCHEQAASA